MSNYTSSSGKNTIVEDNRSELDEIVRRGAQQMLQAALEAEVEEYVEKCKNNLDNNGERLVTRNGRKEERSILSGAGKLDVKQPRVNDRRNGSHFTSSILPPYMRRTPSLDNLIPALYLKGVSTGQFPEALESILGADAAGLSANTVTRLKEQWENEHQEWMIRDLSDRRYVYWWADGIHFNVRLEDERTCMLVLMGTLEDGRKELIGLIDGYRESKLSWQDMFRDLKARGLKDGPELAVGDGALGFWAALREEFGNTREQRCWVHKTSNILDKMPKGVQPRAKQRIHDMYRAATKKEALKAYDEFIALYEAKYPKACHCLAEDKEVLFQFYDFPAEHWQHIRTTNPIESTFATVRHRSRRTKGCGTRTATLAMTYKLAKEAQQHWRRINGYRLIHKVIKGIRFVDGVETEKEQEKAA